MGPSNPINSQSIAMPWYAAGEGGRNPRVRMRSDACVVNAWVWPLLQFCDKELGLVSLKPHAAYLDE